MAKCAICEKGAHFGNNVSHSHRRSNKMWKSNVKSVKVKTEGGAKKMYMLGMGCRKNKESEAVENVAFSCLKENDIYPEAVAALASIDVKKEMIFIIVHFAPYCNSTFRTVL